MRLGDAPELPGLLCQPAPARSGPQRRPAERLEQMARFRNLVVHRYWKVDMADVYRILQEHLPDLTAAGQAVARFLSEHPEL